MGKLVALIFAVCLPLFAWGAGESRETNATNADSLTWYSPEELLDDDTGYGYIDVTGGIVDIFDFESFNVPYDAKIHGVQVIVRCGFNPECNAGGPTLTVLVSADGGATISAAKTTAYSTAMIDRFVGDSGERWPKLSLGPSGTPFFDWRPEVFNNGSSFRVRIQGGWKTPVTCLPGYSVQFRVEYARAKVFYTMRDSDDLYSVTKFGGRVDAEPKL